MNRITIVLIVLAALLGYFFGNAIGSEILGVFGIDLGDAAGPVVGLIFAVVTAILAWVVGTRTSQTEISVEEPAIAHFLFKDPRSSVLWLPARIFLGWEWLDAGLHKVQDSGWMNGGESLRAFWERAVAVPEPPARPSITYEWWRSFLQGLLDAEAYTWFGPLISVGETLVGIALILGALVGVAAFFGIMMNVSFLLSGSTSSNPIMLLLGIALILAWKVAGWIGLDRWLLPALGTPWQRGKVFQEEAPATAPPAAPAPS
jgi:thiosulfate dehydrogenase [quinone] large subunit